MAPTQKTNFKSYESAIRLLAAVVATAKPKLDFKAIALHMGQEFTGPAVDHRLRPIKRLAKMQERYVAEEKNPGDLPVDEKEIARLFGESTADGIEWQFRSIKKLGKAQQEAAKKGEDTSKVTIDGVGTPKTSRSIANTPGSRKRFATAAKTPTTGKRGRTKMFDDDGDDDDLEEEDEADVETPTHKKPKFTDGPVDHGTPVPSASPSQFSTDQPASLFGNGQGQIDRTASFKAPPPQPQATVDDDDDLVEIDSSQFSQSSAKSKLQAATRPKVPKQEPAGADVSSSFADIPPSFASSNDMIATSFYRGANSFGSVPAHENSFFASQNDDDLDEDEA